MYELVISTSSASFYDLLGCMCPSLNLRRELVCVCVCVCVCVGFGYTFSYFSFSFFSNVFFSPLPQFWFRFFNHAPGTGCVMELRPWGLGLNHTWPDAEVPWLIYLFIYLLTYLFIHGSKSALLTSVPLGSGSSLVEGPENSNPVPWHQNQFWVSPSDAFSMKCSRQ